MNFIFTIILIAGLIGVFAVGFKKVLSVAAMIAGAALVVGGFGYGIYVAVESNILSFSIFDTFKYLKMYGKESLISHICFYGGIILAVIGFVIFDS